MASTDRLAAEPPAAEQPPTGLPATGLPSDLPRKVRRIEIVTDQLVDQGVAGDYHSVFKGRGMEFAEVRPYQDGDDVRAIDWNVTARMDFPYVKQFVEERDLTVFLAVDVSGSQSFGSGAILKRELAAEVAALLAFAALRNQDRVGAALISDRLENLLRPQRRRTHVLRLVREILAHPAGGATNLDRGLAAALQTLRQRSVVFLISDFLEASFQRAIKAAAHRHDLVVIEIRDPRDQRLPAVAPVLLRDSETGRETVLSHLDHRRRRRFEERRLGQLAQLQLLCSKLGVDRVELSTDLPYLAPLVRFFERRKRRNRR